MNNDKKRLLYIAVYDPHVPYTGTGARGRQFVNHLAKHFHLDLVYLSGSGHAGSEKLEKEFRDSIQNVETKIRIPFTQKEYFLFSKSLYHAASELLSKTRYDYIIADYGLAAIYGYKLSKAFDVPYIYCSHNIEYKQHFYKIKSDPRRLPLVPYVYHVEKKGVKTCDTLVAISEEEANFYSRWRSKEDMIIIPQGFDETVYHPHYQPVRNENPQILFYGNYKIPTNVEVVRVVREKIVDKVLEKYPNALFQFVGANPPLQYKHPAFEFTGFVNSVIPYLQNADLVISPMMGGWGMPTKVVEALAFGKHVIATPTGARSVPESFKRLTICEVNEFSRHIIRALEENIPVSDVDFGALKSIFSWEVNINKLIQVLK